MKEDIIRDLKAGKDVFLTGAAGCGKTYLLNQIRQDPAFNNPRTLAPTGVAASLIDGETIHRAFWLGISKDRASLKEHDSILIEKTLRRFDDDVDEARKALMNKVGVNFRGIDLIIIDEISYVSKDLLGIIFDRLNEIKASNIPILYVGDFHQLPPVSKGVEPEFSFQSKNWRVNTYILTENKRTANKDFSEVLRKVRVGIFDDSVGGYFEKLGKNKYDKSTLHIFSTNVEINDFNLKMLRNLPGKGLRAECQSSYPKSEVDAYLKTLLVERFFTFKYGARVMFLINKYTTDGELLWYNGEMGTITSCDSEQGGLIVEKDDGVEVCVRREEFVKSEFIKGVRSVKCSFLQFPLRPGYAVSVHKSQGSSFERGHVDCGKFFLPSQFYVAISRFKNPKGVSLSGFNPSHITANKKVLEFYEDVGKNPSSNYVRTSYKPIDALGSFECLPF